MDILKHKYEGPKFKEFPEAKHAGMILGWHWPWISVKDRLPEISENNCSKNILCLFNDKSVHLMFYTSNNSWFHLDAIFQAANSAISHWMYLPELPED